MQISINTSHRYILTIDVSMTQKKHICQIKIGHGDLDMRYIWTPRINIGVLPS